MPKYKGIPTVDFMFLFWWTVQKLHYNREREREKKEGKKKKEKLITQLRKEHVLYVTGKPILKRFLSFFIVSLRKCTSPLVSFLLNFVWIRAFAVSGSFPASSQACQDSPQSQKHFLQEVEKGLRHLCYWIVHGQGEVEGKRVEGLFRS